LQSFGFGDGFSSSCTRLLRAVDEQVAECRDLHDLDPLVTEAYDAAAVCQQVTDQGPNPLGGTHVCAIEAPAMSSPQFGVVPFRVCLVATGVRPPDPVVISPVG
jgi:hypothetical protein